MVNLAVLNWPGSGFRVPMPSSKRQGHAAHVDLFAHRPAHGLGATEQVRVEFAGVVAARGPVAVPVRADLGADAHVLPGHLRMNVDVALRHAEVRVRVGEGRLGEVIALDAQRAFGDAGCPPMKNISAQSVGLWLVCCQLRYWSSGMSGECSVVLL